MAADRLRARSRRSPRRRRAPRLDSDADEPQGAGPPAPRGPRRTVEALLEARRAEIRFAELSAEMARLRRLDLTEYVPGSVRRPAPGATSTW